jgi:predicted small metal-binding protein
MAKSVSCRDAGADCDFSACANTEEELFEKLKDHARTDHRLTEIPKDLLDKVSSAVRDVQQC